MKICELVSLGIICAVAVGCNTQADRIRIFSTRVDGTMLQVDGRGLEGGENALHVFVEDQEVAVTSASEGHIEAVIGPRAPGTYRVSICEHVKGCEPDHAFVVTVGEIGLQGPPGPIGATGPQGRPAPPIRPSSITFYFKDNTIRGPQDFPEARVTCNVGDVATGGSFEFAGEACLPPNNPFVFASRPAFVNQFHEPDSWDAMVAKLPAGCLFNVKVICMDRTP